MTGPENSTSKCSSQNYEAIKEHKSYLGVHGPSMKGRGKDSIGTKYYNARGIYKSKKYRYIHSDVNGAFKIGRLLLPSYFSIIPRNDMQLSPIGRVRFYKSLCAVT